MAEHSTIGEVALMAVQNQVVLLLDDDDTLREGLAMALERPGRTIITCSDLESAQIVIENVAVSHVVSDIRLTGSFAFEGLDFITQTLRESNRTRVIVMTGAGSSALTQEALDRGAVGFLDKPFSIAELELMLDGPDDGLATGLPVTLRVPHFNDIVNSAALAPRFQPIVDLANGDAVIAHEALIRFAGDDPMSNPERLFEYAVRKLRVDELEYACFQKTLAKAKPLLAGGKRLFLNVHPGVLSAGPAFSSALLAAAEEHGIPLDRLVIEITEQASITRPDVALPALDELAAKGILFAFDDVGLAYSHLAYIDRIRPTYLKISQHFGGGFETDSTKVKIVRNILALANDFGCEVILEGIETAETLEAARALGIRYGQGYYLGRPAPAEDWVLPN
jgi:EAL domain-containing protein (putative c-di-GMP-specific phosphodiesterase class I)/ActR/RegA family two-component response regulator